MKPIDMVYCWCDGNDPEFLARKNFYLKREKKIHDSDSVGNHRFVDNEELRYSLRSLTMYAPWINHVYIVTDRQAPKWLNQDYEKVTVIDHSQIMPSDIIPCFVSPVIERYIVNIPGLSEHFLYSNDDMFFGRPINPDFFFCEEQRPIVFVKSYERFSNITDMDDFDKKYESVSTWMKTNMNVWKILYNRYSERKFWVLAHTIDAYTKTLFREVLEKYKLEFQKTSHVRFRDETGISRSIFGLDMVYSKNAELKVINPPSFWQKHIHKKKDYSWECYCGSEDEKTRKQILRFEPYVFCVNADSRGRKEDKIKMRKFYQMLFPEKSPFEL